MDVLGLLVQPQFGSRADVNSVCYSVSAFEIPRDLKIQFVLSSLSLNINQHRTETCMVNYMWTASTEPGVFGFVFVLDKKNYIYNNSCYVTQVGLELSM
jgi:hypothetical protein